MYGDIEVTAEKYCEIPRLITEAGIKLGKRHRLLKDGQRDFTAFNGERLALLETWKGPSDWEVVA